MAQCQKCLRVYALEEEDYGDNNGADVIKSRLSNTDNDERGIWKTNTSNKPH